MLMATEVVTLYHLEDGEVVSKTELNGVTWREKTITESQQKELSIGKKVIVRVPLERRPRDFAPAVGDMLVHGHCKIGLGESDVTLMSAGAVTVQAVANNTQGRSPHWKLEAV